MDLRSLMKFLVHWFTGTCELERIITAHYPQERRTLVQRVRGSIKLSKQLSLQRDALFPVLLEALPTTLAEEVAEGIIAKKNLPRNTCASGLQLALDSMHFTNIGIAHVARMAKQQFSYEENAPMLEELWTLLMPGEERMDNVRRSHSWSQIGFQGLDPSTDFRGGGLLSLENLRFFASRDTNEIARAILREHGRDVSLGGIPFACVGINITAFLLDLALKRRVDDLFCWEADVLFAAAGRQHGIGEREPLLARQREEIKLDAGKAEVMALERFNRCYCVLFVLFAKRWGEAKPKDAMGFPLVFRGFKTEVERTFASQRGVAALMEL